MKIHQIQCTQTYVNYTTLFILAHRSLTKNCLNFKIFNIIFLIVYNKQIKFKVERYIY